MSTTIMTLRATPDATQPLGKATRTPREMYLKRFRSSGLCIVGSLLLRLSSSRRSDLGSHRTTPILVNTVDQFQAPGSTYFFGTDEFGRDIFSRVLYGARIAVQVGMVSVVVAFLGGIVLGLISGYYGGWVDTVLSRLLEIWLSFPDILFVIAVVAILGPRSTRSSWRWASCRSRPSPYRPRLRAERAGTDVCRGSARSRCLHYGIMNGTSYQTWWRRSSSCPACAWERTPHGRRTQLHRPGRPAPGAGMGRHPLRRADVHVPGTVDHGIPVLTIALLSSTMKMIGDSLRDVFDPKLSRSLSSPRSTTHVSRHYSHPPSRLHRSDGGSVRLAWRYGWSYGPRSWLRPRADVEPRSDVPDSLDPQDTTPL